MPGERKERGCLGADRNLLHSVMFLLLPPVEGLPERALDFLGMGDTHRASRIGRCPS